MEDTHKQLLNDEWSFMLDPNDEFSLFTVDAEVPETKIKPTMSWEEQGYGEPSEHDPLGTWKKKREYVGVAWYVRAILIPDDMVGKNITLTLQGVRWKTELWIDGKYVGSNDSLSTPHMYRLNEYVTYGTNNKVVIKVDNRMLHRLGESHIHSYHTATNWGGITGGIELGCEKKHAIQEMRILPELENKSVTFQFNFELDGHQDPPPTEIAVKILDADGHCVKKEMYSLQGEKPLNGLMECVMTLDEIITWSPTHPYLYRVELEATYPDETKDGKTYTFGFREIDTDGQMILLNGEPIFLTGYVDCCIFPKTGYPVWDIDYYIEQFQTIKAYGFNHVRLHGWNPPKPFFDAADRVGMLVQTELPHWSQEYVERTRPADEGIHAFLQEELKRIILALQHHPSFVMLSMGNELTSVEGNDQLNDLVAFAKELDPTRLYTDNTGFGQLPEQDRCGDYYIPTLNWHPPYHISQAALPDTTEDYEQITRLSEKPLIAHEHAQFTTYVRPDEAKKYTGILQPEWLIHILPTLEEKGFIDRVDDFIQATSTHYARTLKESMEKARRTRGLAGIQILDVRDFPGQGHATVGVLDVFGDSKDIIDPNEFLTFNDQTVLLMRSKNRTLFNGEFLRSEINVSHFGRTLTNAQFTWKLMDEDGVIQEQVKSIEMIGGRGVEYVDHIQVAIPNGKARKLTLYAYLEADDVKVENKWDFWTFARMELPANKANIWSNSEALRSVLYGSKIGPTIDIDHFSYKKDEDVELVIAEQLSRDVLQHVVDGGKAWLMAHEGNQFDEIKTKYLPIFWNYLWFPGQTGTTMGMFIHDHPILRNFPHDQAPDWHWYHIIEGRVALNLDTMPGVEPIVEVIDNFNRAKRLAYAFEVNVGKGKLFVSTFNFTHSHTMKLPETNTLFLEILHYLNSDQFNPSATVTVGQILNLFKMEPLVWV